MKKKYSRPQILIPRSLAFLLAGTVLFASGKTVSAAVISQESFDYDVGSLGTQGGWMQDDGSSTSAEVRKDSLSFGNIVTSGNKLEIVTYGEKTLWPLSVDWTQDGSFAMSYMWSKKGDYWVAAGFAEDYSPGTAITTNDGLLIYDFDRDNDPQRPNNTYTSGNTLFVTMELTTRANDDDEATVSIYDEPDENGGISGSTPLFSDTVTGQRDFETLAFRYVTGEGVEHFYIDELRFGESLDDVVVTIPEPTTFALLLLGGVTLLNRRPRRRPSK